MYNDHVHTAYCGHGNTVTMAMFVPILIFLILVFVVLTIFLTLKLKNNLGVYLCWIPSFIALLVFVVCCFNSFSAALFVLFAVFLPLFLSYMPCAIIKLTSKKRKQGKDKDELDKMSIMDL